MGLERDRVKGDYKTFLTYVTRFVVKDREENDVGTVTWLLLTFKFHKEEIYLD